MTKRKRVCRVALQAAAAMAILKIPASVFGDSNTVLVQTGITTAPGAGGGTVFALAEYPVINASGQMALITNLIGTTDGTSQAFMRVEANGSLTPLLRDLHPAPGTGGGTVGGFLCPAVNIAG